MCVTIWHRDSQVDKAKHFIALLRELRQRFVEAARAMGVSAQTIYRMLHEGRIPGALKLGRTWCIPRDLTESREG